MKLFVGLGNPGQKYARNRHNVGFQALDRIVEDAGLGAWRKRFNGLVCDGEIGGERVLLIKPQTYYNEAGRAVREAAKFHKIKVHDIVVFHDEIDLAPGKLRVKTGGGTAGNNGLRSIASHLGPDFTRVRIGVGHPGDKNQVANYVLRDFPKADADWLEVMLDAIARAASRLADGETERFQTDVAQALSDARSGAPVTGNAGPDTIRPTPPATPRRPATKTAGRPVGGGAKTAAKRGGPSQLELAKRTAAAAKKPSRRIKKGTIASGGDGETTSPQADATQPEPSADTALAARLRRWLTGKSKDE